MSQENVEAIRRVYEGWGEGDFRAGVDLLDPLVLFVLGTNFPDAGSYLGRESLANYMQGFLEPWSRITIEAEEFREAGDSVFVAVLQSGVGSESGAPTAFHYFQVWTFRGPRVIRLENFRERSEALEAAGLRE
jgi:ketosteroid isomerase-like protein